jgi:hypothetical protein
MARQPLARLRPSLRTSGSTNPALAGRAQSVQFLQEESDHEALFRGITSFLCHVGASCAGTVLI